MLARADSADSEKTLQSSQAGFEDLALDWTIAAYVCSAGEGVAMMLSWAEIEARAGKFAQDWANESSERSESQTFWNEFLQVFGLNRRRIGGYFELPVSLRNKKYGFVDLFIPGKLLVEHKSGGRNLQEARAQGLGYLDGIDDHDLPKFIVSSNFTSFEVLDLDSDEVIEFSLSTLVEHVRLFGFLIGDKGRTYVEAWPVNKKAAGRIAALHDALLSSGYQGNSLELFLTRLVFCFFAEDAAIFEYKQFHEFVRDRTAEDGSDLGMKLAKLFETLNTEVDKRERLLEPHLMDFPYVNGGLFETNIQPPSMNSALRQIILESSDPDWRQVSPAIFGSMFEAILDPGQRSTFGAHYTSEENILKLIKPLFLDELYAQFDCANKSKARKLELTKFHDSLSKLKFLDPASGSGAFLIVTYRELRRLEHRVISEILDNQGSLFQLSDLIKVSINQMHGIEILESSALITKVSLWLTDHQMNLEASQRFGQSFVRLPLPSLETIALADATTKPWGEIIALSDLDYIIGNPPYVGSRVMNADQKAGLRVASADLNGHRDLDYVCAWFLLAAKAMAEAPHIRSAFVTTNSVCQGLVCSIMWPHMFEFGIEIQFAHLPFRWTNKSQGVAQVHVIILGFSIAPRAPKLLFSYEGKDGEPIPRTVDNISPYLLDMSDYTVSRKTSSQFGLPASVFGNMADPTPLLVITKERAAEIAAEDPRVEDYFMPAWGAKELLSGQPRVAFWLDGISPSQQKQIPILDNLVTEVRESRRKGSRPKNESLGGRFAQISQDPRQPMILMPRHFVEKMKYIPMIFLPAGNTSLDSALAIPGGEKWLFGLLSSSLHFLWMDVVGGKIKSDYRYSQELVYNTFPVPAIGDREKETLGELSGGVISARELNSGSKLSDMYDRNAMPRDLDRAHTKLDDYVLGLYALSPGDTEAERVSRLLKMSQDVT